MKRILIAVLTLAVSLLNLRAQEAKPGEVKKSTPAEAKDLIGKNAVIVGKVSNVHQSEKVTHINFGRPHPNEDFTAVVFSSKTNLFDDLKKLVGKTVEVSGKVEEYHDKPQIVLNSKQQLKVVEDKDKAAPEKPEPSKSDK